MPRNGITTEAANAFGLMFCRSCGADVRRCGVMAKPGESVVLDIGHKPGAPWARVSRALVSSVEGLEADGVSTTDLPRYRAHNCPAT